MKQNFTVRHGALDGVEAFLAVARGASFRKGAEALGVTPSAISQAVRSLERRLGVALFTRTTRSVGLTEAGRRFFDRADPAFQELVTAAETAQTLGQRPSGLLRLSVPRGVMPLIVQPLIASFCRAFPAIELEVAASEELVDLAAGGFDAGIRMGQFVDPEMTTLRLTDPFRLILVASPDYVSRCGSPVNADALKAHALLRVRRSSGSIAPFRLIDGGETTEITAKGPLIANDYPTVLGAAVDGLGIAQVPEPMAHAAIEAAALVELLADHAPTAPGIFLYHPGRKQMLPKLRAFIDHVRQMQRTAR